MRRRSGELPRQPAPHPRAASAAARIRRRPRRVRHLRRLEEPARLLGAVRRIESRARRAGHLATRAEIGNVTPIRANLFNPGPTRTSMRAKAFPGEDPMTLPTPEEVAPSIVAMLQPTYRKTAPGCSSSGPEKSRGYAPPFAGWSAGLRPASAPTFQALAPNAGRRPALQLCWIRANLSYTSKSPLHSAPPHTGDFEELRNFGMCGNDRDGPAFGE